MSSATLVSSQRAAHLLTAAKKEKQPKAYCRMDPTPTNGLKKSGKKEKEPKVYCRMGPTPTNG